MTDPMEATEEFKAGFISESEYRSVLRAVGTPERMIELFLAEEKLARFQSLKHDRDSVYS